MKRCGTCGTIEMDQFSPSRRSICRRCATAKHAEWLAGNRAHYNAYMADWRAAHPERVRELRTETRGRHLVRALERDRRYRQRNAAAVDERIARWRAANPERARENARGRSIRYRARQRGAAGSHTRVEWEQVLMRYERRCAYCHRSGLRLERDHVVPLSCGGTNSIDNIVPACRSCNARKNARDVETWQRTEVV